MPGDVTQLLVDVGNGNRESLDDLFPFVYRELRQLAANYLRHERANHTLTPTALVHEAYLRLINQHSVDWRNKAQFFGIAAHMMRRILVKHASRRHALKRGGKDDDRPLEEGLTLHFDQLNFDFLALDEALTALAEQDRPKAEIVELKFFAGMTNEEISFYLGKSLRTVERDWTFARSWLYKALAEA